LKQKKSTVSKVSDGKQQLQIKINFESMESRKSGLESEPKAGWQLARVYGS
jgi:hypothetical protein